MNIFMLNFNVTYLELQFLGELQKVLLKGLKKKTFEIMILILLKSIFIQMNIRSKLDL